MSFKKLKIAALALAVLGSIGMVPLALAQSGFTNITTTWTNGNLVFTDQSGNALLTISPTTLNVGSAAALQLNGTSISSTAAELNALHGVTAGTATASKAAVLGASKNLDVLALPVGGLSIGAGAGTPVTATAAQLNQYTLNVNMADAGTAGSVFVVAPHAGNIVGLAAVNDVANAGGATTFTTKLGGVSVTHPAWAHGTTDAAGTGVAVVPTAANTVAANGVIEIHSDGGSSAVQPEHFTITINRQ